MEKQSLLLRLRELGISKWASVYKLALQGQYDPDERSGRRFLIIDLQDFLGNSHKSKSANVDGIKAFRDELVALEGLQISGARGVHRLDRFPLEVSCK